MKTAAFRTGLFALVFGAGVVWLNYMIYGQINGKLGHVSSLVQTLMQQVAG